jgi:hypothetical protein
MDTAQLGHVLAEYFEYKGQPAPDGPNGNGIFTIDITVGLVIGAGLVRDGCFELFAVAGYVDDETLREIVGDDGESDLDDHEHTAHGPFMRWEASNAEWFIYVDRDSGRVTLSSVHVEVPRHLAGLMTLLDLFCTVHREWTARLETMPVAEQPGYCASPAQPVYGGFLQA